MSTPNAYIKEADTTVLYKKTLNTLAPVLALNCHETFSKFNAKKAVQTDPFDMAKEQDDVLTCARETVNYVETNYKAEMIKYQECLEANPGNMVKCADLRDDLSKCVLKGLAKK
mmetsp:Transcript_8552/g.12645  ORF Transcript_8552/g.12645 Transcript_8552/m.12645 type:complete len:114 (+) Transcript_8552:129-470(+)|eukprot:CAMPEP_0196810958 /NCGR_PEP_ID=MMETSP1362-20130617/15785_1 /TAXON_ID=163516 /ORGANISM="Leptocylindrus danicus, Strain CCMP1856" /LENGTH=113 /DNA_ID=CAMNT_0042186161 /DNA_START=88 /DNA_END=432 /DNA_ORIENTATION=-